MPIVLPLLSEYDTSGKNEGTLDPLGLYAIADELATQLVPAVRERMARVRFLTAMAVGAKVVEGVAANPRFPQTPPFIVWEWLVIEALVRTYGDDVSLSRMPGKNVTRSALERFGHLDSRTYLKTPRVFGFYGVYKRLAEHCGVLLSNLACHPRHGDALVHVWAKDRGIGDLASLLNTWRRGVEKALAMQPPRTEIGWRMADWQELAEHLHPGKARAAEKRYLAGLLCGEEAALGAFADMWKLADGLSPSSYDERRFHEKVMKRYPHYGTLLGTIQAYEHFSRCLTDAFDIIRAEATTNEERGYRFTHAGSDKEMQALAKEIPAAYHEALARFGDGALVVRFSDRFARFAQTYSAAELARVVHAHHVTVQRNKDEEGKLPWFDVSSDERLIIRRRYEVPQRPQRSHWYVHGYRTGPLASFYRDLQ